MDLKVVDRPHATENAHRNNLIIIVARLPAIHSLYSEIRFSCARFVCFLVTRKLTKY
jgi:hypothetical protein